MVKEEFLRPPPPSTTSQSKVVATEFVSSESFSGANAAETASQFGSVTKNKKSKRQPKHCSTSNSFSFCNNSVVALLFPDDTNYARFSCIVKDLESGVYGSLTDDIRALFKPALARLSKRSLVIDPTASTNVLEAKRARCSLSYQHVCCNSVPAKATAGDDVITIVDSDDEENGQDTANSRPFQDVVPTAPDVKPCPPHSESEVIGPTRSSTSSSRHFAGNEVARTLSEIVKLIEKTPVIPTLCLDEKKNTKYYGKHGNFSLARGSPVRSMWTISSRDRGCYMNQVAHSHVDTIEYTNKTPPVIPSITPNEKEIAKVDTLMAHHDVCGYSVTSDAATQLQSVAVLNFDREDSGEDMSISPLREVSPTDPRGPSSADTQGVGSVDMVNNRGVNLDRKTENQAETDPTP
ncbi:hypothetical protein LINPERHAP1_LOCUS19264 [Linum perenne]